MKRYLVQGLMVALVATAPVAPTGAAAATVTVRGDGEVATTDGTATVVVLYGDGQPQFEFTDRGSDPSRTIALSADASAECLGGLFGGQAVRLSGPGTDSGAPGEAVEVQAFIVDGEPEADRVSVKVRRANGSVTYFAPMRDLVAGNLQVGCAS